MKRRKIYDEIEQMFGLVPTMFKSIPDSTLELEWELFKRLQLEDGAIGVKNRELIGLSIAAVSKCRYCAYFHTEMARLNGATDEEIEEAIHFAKASAGWSAYVNGMQLDFNDFKKEIDFACDHVRDLHLQH
ncbi:carboxymuconolactone decarboxylase family protein [Labilibaculum euxinus]|uniref:Carboxymuconolactone decarboxylase family protein n=1 Tax=Labilibaculum euxinus TaxID=2686357 RepID=A0A7M4D4N3_9BACT|nr:carboxymuconolactone decarboxylase family protein [Labilibaculum euxinus]MUP37612.1 carboxymuconolactone decarboxylase family protein [Labilibaculum euxinus]MVB06817.1 carboxymuconolactone decarboxylase family protein [Labilibaculum euxinus]